MHVKAILNVRQNIQSQGLFEFVYELKKGIILSSIGILKSDSNNTYCVGIYQIIIIVYRIQYTLGIMGWHCKSCTNTEYTLTLSIMQYVLY